MSLADKEISYDREWIGGEWVRLGFTSKDVREAVIKANNRVADLLATYSVDILIFPDLQEIFEEEFGFDQTLPNVSEEKV